VDAQAWSGRGKLLKEDAQRIIAQAAVYGLSPLDILRADPLERRVLIQLSPQIVIEGRKRDELLANRIIWELAESMKKSPRQATSIYPDR
jgi:hypothetical protein